MKQVKNRKMPLLLALLLLLHLSVPAYAAVSEDTLGAGHRRHRAVYV